MILPLDIIGVIAQHLVSADLHATCASLNVTSKLVQDETTATLWECVVYRWNNGQSARKKSARKWKTVFGSESAKHIRYLMAIPSPLPDVAIDDCPWTPAFLRMILDKPQQRLKACIIAGQADKIGIHLYDKYRPGTHDTRALTQCVQVVRETSGLQYLSAVIRPCFSITPTNSKEEVIENLAISRLLARMTTILRCRSTGDPMPVWNIRLIIPADRDPMPAATISRLMVDIMSIQKYAAILTLRLAHEGPLRVGDNGPTRGEGRLPPLDFVVVGAASKEAKRIAKVIKIGYATNSHFAGVDYRVMTRTAVSIPDAIDFIRTLEKNYLATAEMFLSEQIFIDKTLGAVTLIDGTRARATADPPNFFHTSIAGAIKLDRLWEPVGSDSIRGRFRAYGVFPAPGIEGALIPTLIDWNDERETWGKVQLFPGTRDPDPMLVKSVHASHYNGPTVQPQRDTGGGATRHPLAGRRVHYPGSADA